MLCAFWAGCKIGCNVSTLGLPLVSFVARKLGDGSHCVSPDRVLVKGVTYWQSALECAS